jgi:peptide/nickel transport system substrate-binding protein/oligopeptide transport system substrate-binding protein
MKKRIWLALTVAVVLIAAVLALSACGGGDEGSAIDKDAVKGGTISVYINEPVCIEPKDLEESEGVQVGQALFDGLAAYDAVTGDLIPAAADSWEANADATVWTFHLNKDAKFHDGTKVTAKDFVYAWTRLCLPETASNVAWHLEPVVGYDEIQAGTTKELAGVKAIDDYTFEVTLKYSYGDFEFVVGNPTLAPVPQAAVEAMGADAFAEAPVGNGPFMIAPGTKWEHNQGISLVAFKDYYGEKPNIDGIEFKIFTDPAAAFLEFQAGNLDFTSIPSGQIEATRAQYGETDDGYTGNPGKQTYLGAELAIYYVDINLNDPVMSNLDVRKAISLGINRQAICDVAMEGTRVPADNFVPPGMPGYEPGAWEYSRYDVEAAKAALVAAGYPNGEGLEITLSCNSGGAHEAIMTMVQADLEALGITVKTEFTEWAAYLEKLQADEYQIGRMGWIADYPIFDNFMYSVFQSQSANNYSNYNNPEVDAAMTAARATTDTAERIAAWQAINKTIQADVPAIPLMAYRHGRVCSERMNNLVYSAMGLLDFTHCWITGGGK